MRKLVLFMHTSLDNFVAGPNGEMDWIQVSDELFDYAGERTRDADTALYGRVTYQMMDSYWPTAGDQPGASRHDREHAQWYNGVHKVVLSRSMKAESRPDTTFIGDDLKARIGALKQQPGKDILIFGSPGAVHALMQEDLIDELWLFINPVILGKGIPLFKDVPHTIPLDLVNTVSLASGVTGLHYRKK